MLFLFWAATELGANKSLKFSIVFCATGAKDLSIISLIECLFFFLAPRIWLAISQVFAVSNRLFSNSPLKYLRFEERTNADALFLPISNSSFRGELLGNRLKRLKRKSPWPLDTKMCDAIHSWSGLPLLVITFFLHVDVKLESRSTTVLYNIDGSTEVKRQFQSWLLILVSNYAWPCSYWFMYSGCGTPSFFFFRLSGTLKIMVRQLFCYRCSIYGTLENTDIYVINTRRY